MPTYLVIYIVVLSIWLGGCATIQEPQVDLAQKKVSWNDRAEKLASIKRFDINAKIAIRDFKNNTGENSNLDWQQNNQRYSILFYGPMGAGSQKLSGDAGKVVLESGDGKKVTATSPERLLASQTGWVIPVSNLYYWVRGMPVPSTQSKKILDQNNRLVKLYQSGWEVKYLDYTVVGQTYMPRKIQLTTQGLSVKIVISNWKI